MISRDPAYVGRAKAVRTMETERRNQAKEGGEVIRSGNETFDRLLTALRERLGCGAKDITLGSLMVSDQIGDGSSREQAASCQKVLGGLANLANEYATKRYRSNLINWGLFPLRTEETLEIPVGTWFLLRDVRQCLEGGPVCLEELEPSTGETVRTISCTLDALTEEEKRILLAGCLINHYRGQRETPC